ncbi:hypothetical protein [Fuerstiella marisgermanici]|uniref:Uncharacterized protein n=1 Tax=Fuerstiella marisgermanici TaxID=1891926 RepID=A0A1P8WGM1_9PLAN|nr:hypothetical protein [Fuerstiella marisgermanici]APZ93193.1 hypothetical protein Fuma_02810 [Fuerstiella marisgermanici]
MISAHLMCVDNNFKPPARSRIAELFRLNWGQSSLCAAFPEDDQVQDAVDRVGQSLAQGGGVLREVGHDAIFAMHAIKGFRMLPATATKQRVDGICNLIRSFKPWRDENPDNSIEVPPFTDEVAASRFVLREASTAIDQFKGFGQGFAGHMLTYGQSLIELAAIDGAEWAESCRTAFHKYVTVTRKGPQSGDRRIKDHQPTTLRPDDSDYWQQRGNNTLGLGHVFKYPYAYYDLIARAEDEQLARELNSKAWHLF